MGCSASVDRSAATVPAVPSAPNVSVEPQQLDEESAIVVEEPAVNAVQSGEGGEWREYPGMYLGCYAEGGKVHQTLASAQTKCLEIKAGGITKECRGYTLRRGKNPCPSPSGEVSWIFNGDPIKPESPGETVEVPAGTFERKQDSFLGGYADRAKYLNLDDALIRAAQLYPVAGGVTREWSKYSIRKGKTLQPSASGEVSWLIKKVNKDGLPPTRVDSKASDRGKQEEEKEDGCWKKLPDTYLSCYAAGSNSVHESLEEAKRHVIELKGAAGGVTKEGPRRYTVRKGKTPMKSPSGETSWLSVDCDTGLPPEEKAASQSGTLGDLVGDAVVDNSGKLYKVDSMHGKVVALYVSAHWCPPCRAFTPQLADLYRKLQGGGKPFEVIFVSCDQNQSGFDEYFSSMPWKALPFEERATKGQISATFGIRGIPACVLLEVSKMGSYRMFDREGRSTISRDLEGARFPWGASLHTSEGSAPPPQPSGKGDGQLKDLIGDEFVGKSGDTPSLQSMKNKVVGLYFSAHWCPPCRGFTPKLAKVYEKLKGEGEPFEIVFASFDRNTEQFNEYFSEMPWIAIKHGSAQAGMAAGKFGIRGIPSLILLKVDEQMNYTAFDKAATMTVKRDPEAEAFPWGAPST
uniref:Thioredoxin domain-containing protein n=1 Tax=Chromera velia CCMP2878 TaxID=1169474 RepID=A0A0G4FGI9_9ALVE|eukprot:Cvel_16905.t1-p1 / transcript=Cvel_16905.t1 / gene=Cvel_16905 / organism=Chromera_velia_CCMP2878 / gene_product=Probable nucleoredoxin 3, putative / transcript_product=Probable nucleoredoxin 3, putative / location=Cvel_scaffold1323:44748-46640(-) / protein_length=631 / sequence_SO=supercontig / SO=protein_coding / is_pseudo=false